MTEKPAIYPLTGPARTMFVALYGELALHPWRAADAASSDAYSLFVARSSAMRLLVAASESTGGGVWGMNDAGQADSRGSQSRRIAWFQVALTEGARRPLPVQAFLSCAGDVVARLGTPRLDAVQMLLPIEPLDAAPARRKDDGMASVVQDAGWFADCDPRSRAQVRVTLDGGQNQSLRAAAPEMLQWMQGIKQDVFSCESCSVMDAEDLFLEPAISDGLWPGPAGYRATFHGTLAEWSLDGLGWLASFLAVASSRHGVSTPLILTASRVTS